jgi:hypothetical protein
MSHETSIIKEFIQNIPIEHVISEQDCVSNFTSLCRIKKRPGQDSFFDAVRILKLDHNICNSEWEISETPIGEISQNATIYKGTCKDDNKDNKEYDKYVLKYIGIKGRNSYQLKGIATEINLQHRIYKQTGYTTPIYQIFLNDNYLMFITDKLGVTVYRYIFDKIDKGVLSKQDIAIIKNILEICYEMLIDLMTNHSIVHGDEHLNNFMLTSDFFLNENENNVDKSKIKMIDFGKSYLLQSNSSEQSIKNSLYSIQSIFKSNIYDLRFHKNRPEQVSDLLPDEIK